MASSNEGVEAFVGLGANLGDPAATVRGAIDELARLPRSRMVAQSSLYRSAPVDAAGPDYLNAVVCLLTQLEATELLAHLLRIERLHGRLRPYANAPRSLDLDLLLYGDTRMHTPALTLPHPRMHLRAFVLAPLAEIAPATVVPGYGPVRELLHQVEDQRIERLRP